MTVAEMIKQTRTESHMTQEEYGHRFGVTRQTVSSWENERSLPDLQMLIDICNTYHISLDKLLNEDKKFVGQIDFNGKIRKLLKTGAFCAIAVLAVFVAILVRWKITAEKKNGAFAANAAQMGFILENGVYQLEKNDVCYRLPNQKLPFLKEDFHLKQSRAEFKIGDNEIEAVVYDEDAAVITWNHYRQMKGTLDEDMKFQITENHLNAGENRLFQEHVDEIQKVLEQLLAIHRFVYA